jgi:hypothetical protein
VAVRTKLNLQYQTCLKSLIGTHLRMTASASSRGVTVMPWVKPDRHREPRRFRNPVTALRQCLTMICGPAGRHRLQKGAMPEVAMVEIKLARNVLHLH